MHSRALQQSLEGTKAELEEAASDKRARKATEVEALKAERDALQTELDEVRWPCLGLAWLID